MPLLLCSFAPLLLCSSFVKSATYLRTIFIYLPFIFFHFLIPLTYVYYHIINIHMCFLCIFLRIWVFTSKSKFQKMCISMFHGFNMFQHVSDRLFGASTWSASVAVAWLLERPEVAPPQAEVAEPPPDGDLDWEISVETVAGFPGAVRARRIPPCPTWMYHVFYRFLISIFRFISLSTSFKVVFFHCATAKVQVLCNRGYCSIVWSPSFVVIQIDSMQSGMLHREDWHPNCRWNAEASAHRAWGGAGGSSGGGGGTCSTFGHSTVECHGKRIRMLQLPQHLLC